MVRGGMKASVAIAEHKTAIRTANGRIVSFKTWYEGVRKNYSSK